MSANTSATRSKPAIISKARDICRGLFAFATLGAMGRNYSFDMRVPRDRLFEAFSSVARRSDSDFSLLIWPDGRRLPSRGKRLSFVTGDLIPVDGSMEESFCLSFRFPTDDALRDYAKEHEIPQNEESYSVGCIWTSIEEDVSRCEWINQEAELVPLQFTAATSAMSDLFVHSSSVQRWFVSLAREIGAFSCELDLEGPTILLFLDGEEMRIGAQQWAHDLLLRYRTPEPNSDAARKAFLCDYLDEDSSAHERLEVQLCLHDENSGIRARALKALTWLDASLAFPFLEVAAYDNDWRVRAVVAHLLRMYESHQVGQLLERMLTDVHPEVRIAATLTFMRYDTSVETLSRVLLTTPVTSENLGWIKAALISLGRKTFMPQGLEVIETVLSCPDFPFKNSAAKILNDFRPQN